MRMREMEESSENEIRPWHVYVRSVQRGKECGIYIYWNEFSEGERERDGNKTRRLRTDRAPPLPGFPVLIKEWLADEEKIEEATWTRGDDGILRMNCGLRERVKMIWRETRG